MLDEPAAGLDPEGRRNMYALIKGLHTGGRTVIMVSHSMDDVGRLCERIIVLNKGRKAFDGKPHVVFRHAEELESMGLSVPESVKLANVLRLSGFSIPEDVTDAERLAKAIAADLRR